MSGTPAAEGPTLGFCFPNTLLTHSIGEGMPRYVEGPTDLGGPRPTPDEQIP